MNKIVCGDCVEVLKEYPDNYFDSVVTDPPYGLSSKRSSERIFDIFQRSFNVVFPNFNEFNIKRTKYSDLVKISLQGSDLSGAEVMNVIKPFVCMPEGSVYFDGYLAVGDKEVETGRISSSYSIPDFELMDEADIKRPKYIGNYILDFGDSFDFSGGNVGSRNIGEASLGCFAMPIGSIFTTLFPISLGDNSPDVLRNWINDIIGVDDNSLGEALRASFVLASGATENCLMLRFNLTDTSSKLNATISTTERDTISQFVCPKLIRTSATASSLSSKLEPCAVSFVASSANGTDSIYYLHLYLPKGLINNISTISEKSSGFMGKKWDYDVPSVEAWQEVFRVLKPGGYLLSFGGTRTYHRLVVNIEDAGFEIRDQIQWLYGSGFPKSLNIGKAVDKLQGNEREIVGEKKFWGHNAGSGAGSFSKNTFEGQTGIIRSEPLTKGTSEWEGFGTALKPANEPICLARKPLSEKNVALNVLKWGTGGLNIDASRIGTGEDKDGGSHPRPCEPMMGGGIKQRAEKDCSKGRFPANAIFNEEAAALLDEQSGERPSGKSNNNAAIGESGVVTPMRRGSLISRNDSGGASRFFKQCDFTGDDICESVNIAERNLSLQDQVEDFVLSLVAIEGNQGDRQLSDLIQPFMNEMRKVLKKSSETNMQQMIDTGQKCLQGLSHIVMEMLNNNPVKYVEAQRPINTMMIIQNLLSIDGFAEVVMSDTMLTNMVLGERDLRLRFNYCAKASRKERGEGNDHPTVKPVKLMRYLVKLITPPNGIVLDPFCGSGTTGIACQEEGFGYTLIDMDEHNVDIAKERNNIDIQLALDV